MSQALLEQVKSKKGSKRQPPEITNEHIEVALAWLKDEVTRSQMSKVFSPKASNSGNILYKVALWLQEAYKKGKLEIKK